MKSAIALKDPSAFLLKARDLIERTKHKQDSYVRDAIIAGQMLREMRQQFLLGVVAQSEMQPDSPSETIDQWLKMECPCISRRTAYRWIAGAERIVGLLLEIHHSNAPLFINLDGEEMAISEALTRPSAESSEAVRTFQGTFDTFIADKTFNEAAACALDGESAESRVTRAANGKLKGGAGGNRRAYARFMAEHFKLMNQSIERWDKFMAEHPGEHAQMTEAIRAIILGGKFKIKEHGRPVDFKGWPLTFSELMLAVVKERVSAARKRLAQENA